MKEEIIEEFIEEFKEDIKLDFNDKVLENVFYDIMYKKFDRVINNHILDGLRSSRIIMSDKVIQKSSLLDVNDIVSRFKDVILEENLIDIPDVDTKERFLEKMFELRYRKALDFQRQEKIIDHHKHIETKNIRRIIEKNVLRKKNKKYKYLLEDEDNFFDTVILDYGCNDEYVDKKIELKVVTATAIEISMLKGIPFLDFFKDCVFNCLNSVSYVETNYYITDLDCIIKKDIIDHCFENEKELMKYNILGLEHIEKFIFDEEKNVISFDFEAYIYLRLIISACKDIKGFYERDIDSKKINRIE